MKRLLLVHAILLAAAAAGALPACNSKPLQSAPVPSTPTSTTGRSLFDLVVDGPSAVEVGKEAKLSVDGTDELGAPVPLQGSVVWKSANPSIATVGADGTIKALTEGAVSITASISTPPREKSFDLAVVPLGKLPTGGSGDPISGPVAGLPGDGSGPLPVSSTQPEAGGLDILPKPLRVAVGERIRVVAMRLQNGRSQAANVTWRSDNTAIASVDEGGLVLGRKGGRVQLIATTLDGLQSGRASLDVLPKAPATAISGISVQPSRLTLAVGETAWLTASVPVQGGSFDARVRWESGDATIASVGESGQVTGLAPGITRATAVALGYDRAILSAFARIEVRNAVAAWRLLPVIPTAGE
jgi:hypothetical protein